MHKTLLAALCATAALSAENADVKAYTLDNGMKVLVQEDHNIPNVALYLFFRVGSRNERPGITGISHFFEHMMFNGAKKYGPKQFDNAMEKAGGNNNAYTSRRRHRLHGLVPLHRAGPDVRHGIRPHPGLGLRPQDHGVRTRRRLLRAALLGG